MLSFFSAVNLCRFSAFISFRKLPTDTFLHSFLAVLITLRINLWSYNHLILLFFPTFRAYEGRTWFPEHFHHSWKPSICITYHHKFVDLNHFAKMLSKTCSLLWPYDLIFALFLYSFNLHYKNPVEIFARFETKVAEASSINKMLLQQSIFKKRDSSFAVALAVLLLLINKVLSRKPSYHY